MCLPSGHDDHTTSQQEQKLTKQEFINNVWESNTDLSKKQVENLLSATFSVITDSAKKGEKVSWPGFGSFEVTERAARNGRNPQTGAPLKIAASKTLKFKASKKLKEQL